MATDVVLSQEGCVVEPSEVVQPSAVPARPLEDFGDMGGLYDFTKPEEGYERADDGLTPELVRSISAKKDEPEWMLELRLHCLDLYESMKMPPNWGPSIEGLDMDHISAYVAPNTEQSNSWEDVPEDIKDTFERLGIPEAERASLAGVGAQYDSELVYHNMREEVAEQGVVYSGIEEALHGPYAELIHERFMKLVPPPTTSSRRFTAPFGAVARLSMCPPGSRSTSRFKAISA